MNERPTQIKYGSTIIVRKITLVRTSIILRISEGTKLSIIEEVSHKRLNVGHTSKILYTVFCGFTQSSLA
jgi:hypothetical protein